MAPTATQFSTPKTNAVTVINTRVPPRPLGQDKYVTLFVGNIARGVEDETIARILAVCINLPSVRFIDLISFFFSFFLKTHS